MTISPPVVFSHRVHPTFQHFLIAVTESNILGVCLHQFHLRLSEGNRPLETDKRNVLAFSSIGIIEVVWVWERPGEGVGLRACDLLPSIVEPIRDFF